MTDEPDGRIPASVGALLGDLHDMLDLILVFIKLPISFTDSLMFLPERYKEICKERAQGIPLCITPS